MGIGMTLIVEPEDKEKALGLLPELIELGEIRSGKKGVIIG